MGVYPLNRARISVLKEKDELTNDDDSDPDCGGGGEPNVNSPCGIVMLITVTSALTKTVVVRAVA